VSAREDNIADILRNLVGQRDSLVQLGARCREFVLARHDAVANARRTVADYRQVMTAKQGLMRARA
jgi:DNA-directed RNA polymerase specialized sigma54-like protein